MQQENLIAAIRAALDGHPDLRALFLVGSFGKGTADAFSDVDLLAIVEPPRQATFAADWRRVLEGIAPVVFWHERAAGGVLLNAVTADWLRCDMVVAGVDALARRSKDTVRALIDPGGLYGQLPERLARPGPSRARVASLIDEFIRVLGLTPVVLGRGEYVTGVMGVGLQRDALQNLMVEALGDPDPGGALHLSRLLPAEEMQVLLRLPYPAPEREAIIRAHLAIAREFMPRARALADRLALPWPDRFQEATRRHLQRSFGEEFDASW